TATGIDLVVDDTPRAILVSCFDPLRREIARQSIERLVEDGRIHPARIEEVVAKVRDEVDTMVEEAGSQAAFALGIPDLHARLCKLVGRMRYRTHHGQNLLAHAHEVALIAAHMADELGAKSAVVRRAGLLHEVGRVDETSSGNPILVSAELAGRYGESEEVVHAIQSLHSEVAAKSIEALLLATANRISDHRPGARKENLEIFIERLRRLEVLAASYPGVTQAFAVKAGKELRVILDAKDTTDEQAYALSKEVARRIERELQFPGQIKVSVVRETRAVQFAV
ncbi:MAG TPA: HDIG domain-containing protein, partial [Candidatus Polarisedimenticolaceae bacterium]|nr:HDIG domain-containing protein [Candidatus Polarisedimenticolaceae bacterium]